MVAPVVGPIVKTTRSATTYTYKKGYKQARPYLSPLPYESNRMTGRAFNMAFDPESESFNLIDFVEQDGQKWAWLGNKVYDKLLERMSDRAQLGAAVAEAGQSWGALTGAFGALAKGTRAVRRGDFGLAAKVFSLNDRPQGVSRTKHWSANWLAYHFGWEPLVKDIYSAIDVLQSPLKSQWIRAAASDSHIHAMQSGGLGSSGGDPNSFYPGLTNWALRDLMKSERVFASGCTVAVENPNLFLANQLGLLNPGAVAWELVPFSFVVDWIGNVGQVINSMTDFYGLAVSNGWTTRRVRAIYEYSYQYNYRWVENGSYVTGGGLQSKSKIQNHTIRTTGIVVPELTFTAKAPGMIRALTMFSLFNVLFRR